MRFARSFSGLSLALVAGASIVLSGCGGGGGGGSSGGGGGSNTLQLITAQGVTTPLWQNVAGTPTPAPVCPAGVFINSTITFTFNGAVSALSLPQNGVAIGSINIIIATGPSAGQPALGSFTVLDDPTLPAGNQRRVTFSPTPPGNPNAQCASGFGESKNYQITIPKGGASPQVLVVNGSPLANDATTCFITCGCPTPGVCASSFTDPIQGAPFVVSTTPQSGEPPPAPIDPVTIVGNTIQILISEALNPAGINLANVRVINSATGAQVPGTLNFFQAGSIPGLGVNSRIDYIASSPLLGSVTYEIVFGPQVQDFGGNPIQTSPTNPALNLFFQTTAVTFCAQPGIIENFDTTANRDLVVDALRWVGDGVLQTEFPLNLTGTGVDGPFNPPAGMLTLLDTTQLVGGVSRMGIWNFTDVNIPATAIVRVIGPFLAHFRCTGTCIVDGTINVDAGMLDPAIPGTPAYDRRPEQGLQNNGGGSNCEAVGGVANAGGGNGGTGSGITPPPGSVPTFQCLTRANAGENGFGPTLSGNLNNGSTPNIFYGGGQGGDSGCFPASTTAPCMTGDLGGLGGAGGSAGRVGEAGVPRQPTAACLPVTPVAQPIAQPTSVPVAMTPPITVQSAGSGGGGGGDHLDTTGVPNEDQGGGGGGGGGGIRISCVGAYSQGTAVAAGTIVSRGAQGATAQTLGGAGGSGSGGEIWIQSFSTVTITPNAIMNVDGPTRLSPTQGNIGCSNQASGGGGDGLVQLEAGQGPTPTPTFMILPVPTPTTGAVFSAPPFQYSGGVTGQATSKFYYTGYGAPDYTGVVEATNIGTAAGAVLTIRYEGAQEAVNSTAQTPVFDPATIKSMATGGGNITAANIATELDGYAFVRFIVNVSYPAPPATPQNAILPSVDQITINYSAALNCP